MPPMLITTGTKFAELAPEGSWTDAENLAVLPPALTEMLTVFPARVAVTFSCEWSG